jgi:hypothetical protein
MFNHCATAPEARALNGDLKSSVKSELTIIKDVKFKYPKGYFYVANRLVNEI